jgi:hypothetical protein
MVETQMALHPPALSAPLWILATVGPSADPTVFNAVMAIACLCALLVIAVPLGARLRLWYDKKPGFLPGLCVALGMAGVYATGIPCAYFYIRCLGQPDGFLACFLGVVGVLVLMFVYQKKTGVIDHDLAYMKRQRELAKAPVAVRAEIARKEIRIYAILVAIAIPLPPVVAGLQNWFRHGSFLWGKGGFISVAFGWGEFAVLAGSAILIWQAVAKYLKLRNQMRRGDGGDGSPPSADPDRRGYVVGKPHLPAPPVQGGSGMSDEEIAALERLAGRRKD